MDVENSGVMATSTTEAKYVAASDAAKEAFWLGRLTSSASNKLSGCRSRLLALSSKSTTTSCVCNFVASIGGVWCSPCSMVGCVDCVSMCRLLCIVRKVHSEMQLHQCGVMQ